MASPSERHAWDDGHDEAMKRQVAFFDMELGLRKRTFAETLRDAEVEASQANCQHLLSELKSRLPAECG